MTKVLVRAATAGDRPLSVQTSNSYLFEPAPDQEILDFELGEQAYLDGETDLRGQSKAFIEGFENGFWGDHQRLNYGDTDRVFECYCENYGVRLK